MATPAATFSTFDDLLARYTGDVKARMEAGGDCTATSTAMFSTNESVARAELARLKAANAVYAAWLATPQGQVFEANLGDPDELKFVSYLGATTFEPAEFTAPLYAPPDDDGATGQDGPDERELPIVGTGLDCLPQSVSNGADLTLANKLVVLNCLVFSTPHEFWGRYADDLLANSRYNTWLEYGEDWSCTNWMDASDATCRKHDVAFASLQRWVGTGEVTEMDQTWNPRNKHLADAKFAADFAKYNCEMPSNFAWIFCGFGGAIDATLGTEQVSGVMHFGVNKINSPWPVTRHDVEHSEGIPRFLKCETPKITEIRPVDRNPSFDVSWTYSPGCVGDISVDTYRFCWSFKAFGRNMEDCLDIEGNETSMTFTRLFVSDVTLDSVEIRPNEITYRGFWYDFFDFILPVGGVRGEVYYVKQPIGEKY